MKIWHHLMRPPWRTLLLLFAVLGVIGLAYLLGVPAYDDAWTEYHSPDVENLQNALAGIHEALGASKELPKNYAGLAIYCEWEMDTQKWSTLEKEFGRARF